MKLLVVCPLPDHALAELRVLATELVYEPDLPGEQLAKRIAGVGILIVGRTRVAPEVFAAADALQLVVRCGTPVTNIAINAASDQGIFVAHCPDHDAVAIAEWIFGMIIALDREIVHHATAGESAALEPLEPRGLHGRTLGILGFNAVGRQLAHRGRAFGMAVRAWSATLTPDRAAASDVEFCNWPRELARSCDVIAVHAPPSNPDELVIDGDLLQSLREGAYFVYVGHPAALNESALASVVAARSLRVAIDWQLFDPGRESSRAKSALRNLPDVFQTVNQAADSAQARDATATEVARTVRQFLVAGEVRNCVNLLERSPATWQLVLRVRDQVGVMASILEAIRTDGINAEEVASRVFSGAKAAWCTVSLDERPSTEALDAIRALPDVLHLDLRAVL